MNRITRNLRAALRTILLLVTASHAGGVQAQNYTWQSVKIVGGGFVDGIVAHPLQNGLFYARTDVGGAYRYNSSTSTWVPLTDWVTPSEWQYMGIESLAIDPNNVNKLYLAAGEYTGNWDNNGAILISSNQGASTDEGAVWTLINTPSTQYGEMFQIVGDWRTFGTVYVGTSGRGIVYGTSPN